MKPLRIIFSAFYLLQLHFLVGEFLWLGRRRKKSLESISSLSTEKTLDDLNIGSSLTDWILQCRNVAKVQAGQ